MQYQYVVSAQKSGAVTACVSGAFTSSTAHNLIVARGSRIEISELTADGSLRHISEHSLHGHIRHLRLVPAGEGEGAGGTAALLVTSERSQFAVLRWDSAEQRLVTESTGGWAERTGRAAIDTLVVVDAQARAFAVCAYQGIVHVFGLGAAGAGGDAADVGEWPYAVRDDWFANGLLAVPRGTAEQQAQGSLVRSAAGAAGAKRRGKARAFAARATDVHMASVQTIDELRLLDMVFVRDAAAGAPVQLAVLAEDAAMARHVRVYAMRASDGWQAQPMWASPAAASATRLVALPHGALLVLGADSIAVVCAPVGDGAGTRADVQLARRPAEIGAVAWIDAAARERLLVADADGELSLVVLQWRGGGGGRAEAVCALHVERLGAVPAASALAYIAAGCVYVGTRTGDPLLARLHTQPVAGTDERTFVQPLSAGASLAPLVDLCVAGQTAPGRGGGRKAAASVVACCGAPPTPSLRVVRNGVGIARLGDLAAGAGGVQRVWVLRVAGSADAMDVDSGSGAEGRMLVVASLATHTLVVGWDEPSHKDGGDTGDIDEPEISVTALPAASGWTTSAPTLAAGATTAGTHAVQVTPDAVLLLDATGTVCSRWQPPARISAASVASDRVALAMGDTVALVTVDAAALHCVAQRGVEAAVACIDVHAWDACGPATHVAVGLWAGGGVQLLALPDLQPITPALPPLLAAASDAGASADTAVLPRSLLMCTLGATRYLLVGLGDGRLVHYALTPDACAVLEHKCVRLGSRPLSLAPFRSGGVPSVFAASDHSAVLFAAPASSSAVARLMYATVDAADVVCAAAVDASSAFAECLCLASGDALWLGRPDPVQRLHMRTQSLPPASFASRVARAPAVLGVASILSLPPGGASARDAPWPAAVLEAALRPLAQDAHAQTLPSEYARFAVLEPQTLQPLADFALAPFEMPESLVQVECLGSEPMADAFALGTSVTLPGEDDARSGRVLILQWSAASGQLNLVGEFATAGAVYALHTLREMLVACVANRLVLLGWQKRVRAAESAASEPVRLAERVWRVPDSRFELQVLCSQQTQIASVCMATLGDYVVVGDLLASASLYHYQQSLAQAPDAAATADAADPDAAPTVVVPLRHRLVPVARDAAGLWTTAVACVPPVLSQNHARLQPPSAFPAAVAEADAHLGIPTFTQAFRGPAHERFVVCDSQNLVRMVHAPLPASQAGGAQPEPALLVEARWSLGDQVNVIRPGSLVMDIPDSEFPDCFRPNLLFGTLGGALGVVASVEDGRLGRILDRLQVNMARLLPTPGLWDYAVWRAYQSDQRQCEAFGFLDGDLIESFLDLAPNVQQLVVCGNRDSALVSDAEESAEVAARREFWQRYSRVEVESDCAVHAQMCVSDIASEEGVTVDFVVAKTPAQLSCLISDYSTLVIYFYNQSTVSAETLVSFGNLSRNIPSYQFAHINLDSSPLLSSLPYFNTTTGIAVFKDHQHTKSFGREHEIFTRMDYLDRAKLDSFISSGSINCSDEDSAKAIGMHLAKLVQAQIKSLGKSSNHGNKTTETINISINVNIN
ncbi:DNA damage-binding protein 1a [Coemansia sp. Benny D115]|nr:DNA damage-binding protein 1a [Coemansia sp. Benny D115]